MIAVIGDGSLSSGVAFEGLNNAAEQGAISSLCSTTMRCRLPRFRCMYGPLARLRASGGTAQPNLFNAFGLDYRYVEAGNDVSALVAAFEEVRDIDHPVVVHIHTLKARDMTVRRLTQIGKPPRPHRFRSTPHRRASHR